MSPSFPFTAVIGQSQMKLALLLCAIDPGIGGVLLSGGRGSAKSTLVRSLPALLETKQLVTMPLGASEEMVTGSIQLERALKQGDIAFNPGILARAHQGLLYVDEVNLLPDHLVDLLLDVAASKVNLIERDGISHEHPADFVLIGTMNPDEGELRPQLLDRFGLMASVQSRFDIAERQQIVAQRLAFDRAPAELIKAHADAMQSLSKQLQSAVQNLKSIQMPANVGTEIAMLCEKAGVEGLRADITLHRAATAHAAFQGGSEVCTADVEAVSELVLAHRRNTDASSDTNTSENGEDSGNGSQDNTPSGQSGQSDQSGGSSIQGSWGAMAPQPVASNAPVNIDDQRSNHTLTRQQQSTVQTTAKVTGDYSGRQSVPGNFTAGKPDWFHTLIAPENRTPSRGQDKPLLLHRKRPLSRAIELDMILLDTSASTLGGGGLAQAKGIIRSISKNAYLARRQLSIVSFGNEQVQTVLNPQKAPKDIEPLLRSICGGGGTPLVKALQTVRNLLGKMHHRNITCTLYILSDGRTELGVSLPCDLAALCEIILLDIESTPVKLSLGKQLAQQLGARYINAAANTHSL